MRTFKGLSEFQASFFTGSASSPWAGCVLTIGNFDGLHVGHRTLISQLTETAKKLKIQSVVLTFDPHPSRILRPQNPASQLFTQEDLQEQLKIMGVDYLVVEPFTRDFSLLSAEQFLGEFIVPLLKPQKIIVGHDFALGRERSGSLEVLSGLAQKMKFQLLKMAPVFFDEKIISSSLIRQIIRRGDVVSANKMLGRPYYLAGEVVHGDGRGGKLGFPTANLELTSEVVPALGVYITRAIFGQRTYPSVTNVGHRPTFYGEQKLSVETHVLTGSPDLYNQNLRLELLTGLRSELKFQSTHELISQITQDVADAKKYFGI